MDTTHTRYDYQRDLADIERLEGWVTVAHSLKERHQRECIACPARARLSAAGQAPAIDHGSHDFRLMSDGADELESYAIVVVHGGGTEVTWLGYGMEPLVVAIMDAPSEIAQYHLLYSLNRLAYDVGRAELRRGVVETLTAHAENRIRKKRGGKGFRIEDRVEQERRLARKGAAAPVRVKLG